MAGIPIADNFNIQMQKPLDGRVAYSTLSSMKSQVDTSIYDGCLAYCSEDDKYYKFLSTNTVDPDTGKWREFSSGGGGGTTYTAGDGIDITDDTISIDPMPAEDMDEIIDALPSGGQVVLIKDAFNKGDLYSTDERLIGQWTDGKPLYQKSINCGTMPNETTKKVAHGISNLGKVVSIEGTAQRTSGYTSFIPKVSDTVPSGGISNQIGLYVSSTDIEFDGRYGDHSTYGDCYITLKYTKTTDSPIAIGSDTEYSTTEKIVGTWVGGEPVYQKTISKTINSTAGSWTDFETMANVNVLEFVGYSTDGSQNYPIPYSSGSAYLTFRHESGKIQYITSDSSWINNNTVNLTIRYTKTTT